MLYTNADSSTLSTAQRWRLRKLPPPSLEQIHVAGAGAPRSCKGLEWGVGANQFPSLTSLSCLFIQVSRTELVPGFRAQMDLMWPSCLVHGPLALLSDISSSIVFWGSSTTRSRNPRVETHAFESSNYKPDAFPFLHCSIKFRY